MAPPCYFLHSVWLSVDQAKGAILKTMFKREFILAYLGSVPFLIAAACVLVGVENLPVLGSVPRAMAAYGLLIASFMAGSHWGQHLHLEGFWCRRLAFFSNIIAVLSWLGFVLLPTGLFFLWLVLAFLALLLTDYLLVRAVIIKQDYWVIRYSVTLVMVLSLLVAAGA